MLTFDPKRMTERQWEQIRQTFEQAASEGEVVSVASFADELSPNEVAELLMMSRASVMKLIRSGQLQARKVGSHYRIPAREAERCRDEMMAAMAHGVADDIRDELGLD
ncbi:helix-turn-helix domain-containing protein [Nesterenkonia ebinurensis]|uniref:helix-turn-helix domain-containing protein n=1 Tax=Nesterenkonia ebinurensis TaxID=2608252 RepID=UPI00168BFC6A|nr:helix-turn-helix domain-containing protein [Nesterenkonia ebinurensis]